MDYLYETHMHTAEVSACAVSTAAEQVNSYKQKGYTGIIVTDHFVNGNSTCPRALPWEKQMKHFATGYMKAKKAGDDCGLDVFFGWEFSIRGSDFLTYGLDLDFLIANPGLDLLDIESYSSLVRSNGGYLAQAHPYREAWYVEYCLPVEYHLLDGVEVLNTMDTGSVNAKALDFAKKHNLPIQAGSDSHNSEHPAYSGIKLQKKAESIFDIIEAIKANNIAVI